MGVFSIRPAESADLDSIRVLFREYAAGLPIDLGYQGFELELAALPGKYAPPDGQILLAEGAEGHPLGCVALRPHEGTTCEMKRLYVGESSRGMGLGKALVEAIIDEARRAGYENMVLDTLPDMTGALHLYRSYGFIPVPPYYPSPVEQTVFMCCDLTGKGL